MKTHKDLDIWKDSVELVKEIYCLTANFPKEELYGLTAQIRRCSISIPSNIAEGAARSSTKEFIQFLYIALGSCAELDTQLIIAQQLGYLQKEDVVTEKLEKIKSKILGLIKYLRNKNAYK